MRRGIARMVGTLVVGAAIIGPDATIAQQQPAPAPNRAAESQRPAARREGAVVTQAGSPRATQDPEAAKIQPAPTPDPRRMDAVLEAWAKRTQATKSLYVKFLRTDIVSAWNDQSTYEGLAVLRTPNLAYLDFKLIGAEGKATPHERIVVTPDFVYQFDSPKQQVHIYQMAQDAQQRAMDEGPLPFLFNMNVAQARERYAMTLARESEKHFLVSIDPKAEADKEAFGRAYIWLNKSTFQPDRIMLIDPNNGKDTKSYDIQEIKVNVDLQDNWFNGKGQAEQVAKAKWDLVFFGPEGEQIQGPPGAAPAVEQPAQAAPSATRR